MKRYLFFALLALCCFDASAVYRYRLYLKDKEGSEQYPLSERALNRRANQGIELDSTDLEVSPLYLDSLKQAGFEVLLKSRWMNTVVVRKASGASVSNTVFDAMSYVSHYEKITTTESVSSPRRRTLPAGGGDKDYEIENFRKPIRECKGQALLDHGYCGQGMLVAVIDAGFVNANLLDATKDKIVGCADMIRPGDETYLYTYNEDHGVMCLSIMCSDYTYGVWGSAPQASYFLIRTECSPSETPFEEDTWISGAEYADSIGADVISSSLGYYHFDNTSYNHSQSQLKTLEVYISQAAEIGSHKGMFICLAAGNERGTTWDAIDFPANVPGVLSVGATDPQCKMTYFSSPGWTVPYVKPDVVCRGQSSYMINPYDGSVTKANGTSFATPLMAGLCTSLWSAVPDITAEELLDIVRRSSSHYETPDSLSGYGFPNFSVALAMAQEVTGLSYITDQLNAEEDFCFDLQGRPITNPRKNSLFIRQKGGKVMIIRE